MKIEEINEKAKNEVISEGEFQELIQQLVTEQAYVNVIKRTEKVKRNKQIKQKNRKANKAAKKARKTTKFSRKK